MTSTPNNFVGVTASSPVQAVTGAVAQHMSVQAVNNSPGMTPNQMAGNPQMVGMTAAGIGLHQVVQQAPVSVQGSHSSHGGMLSSGVEAKVLDKRRLQELVKEVDPLEQLDEDVEEVLMQIADDFIENVVTASCKIAKHRKSNTLDVKDVQLHLERGWGMWIPGFGTDDLRPYKRACTTEAHKQRMALIRKTLKKS